MSIVPALLLAVVAGLAIGILSGMFGIGGGAMFVPLLHLLFQVPILNASASSLLAIAPTALSGTLRHLRQKTVNIRSALFFGIPGAAASSGSALLAGSMPSEAILALTIAVIVFCAYRVFREALKKPIDDEGRTSKNRLKTQRGYILASIAIGLLAGFIAGLVGIGGGFIIVPFGIAILGMTMKEVSAISLLAIFIIAIPGIIVHAMLGHIWYLYSIALALGTIPGASIGVWLLSRVPERALRFAYGFLLVFSGIMLIVNRIILGS
ncbi:MAG: sulfite exporter TauE/SafE family protein [Coriobacteriia bacterium]|nr:sulfite exporter TauE/SafE family protein [Coriobacteriia bacterium]